ncbi:MAG: hypothetical protein HOK45_13895 [Verrucomicrobia bacterium]|nr:hypothetical protein [Verrucomicrobiota bacterium]
MRSVKNNFLIAVGCRATCLTKEALKFANKSAGNGKNRDAKQSLAASLKCIVDLSESSKPSFLVILCDDLEYGNQVEKRHSL